MIVDYITAKNITILSLSGIVIQEKDYQKIGKIVYNDGKDNVIVYSIKFYINTDIRYLEMNKLDSVSPGSTVYGIFEVLYKQTQIFNCLNTCINIHLYPSIVYYIIINNFTSIPSNIIFIIVSYYNDNKDIMEALIERYDNVSLEIMLEENTEENTEENKVQSVKRFKDIISKYRDEYENKKKLDNNGINAYNILKILKTPTLAAASSKELIMEVLKYSIHIYDFLSEEQSNDIDIILQGIQLNHSLLNKIPKCYSENMTFLIKAIEYNGLIIEYIIDMYDINMIVLAIKNDVLSFKYLKREFYENRNIILQVIYNFNNLTYEDRHILDYFNNDKEIVLAFISLNGSFLDLASKKLQGDKKVVLSAIKNDPMALRYASDNLRNDKETVLTAVKIDANALEYASDILRNNRQVVLAAIESNISSVKYISANLLNNKEIALIIVKKNGLYLENVSNILRNNRDVVSAAVCNDGYAFKYASVHLRNDKNLLIQAVNNKGKSLLFAPKNIKNDRDVVLAAVNNDGLCLKYVLDSFCNDYEIGLTAVKNNSKSFKYLSKTLQNDNVISSYIK